MGIKHHLTLLKQRHIKYKRGHTGTATQDIQEAGKVKKSLATGELKPINTNVSK